MLVLHRAELGSLFGLLPDLRERFANASADMVRANQIKIERDAERALTLKLNAASDAAADPADPARSSDASFKSSNVLKAQLPQLVLLGPTGGRGRAAGERTSNSDAFRRTRVADETGRLPALAGGVGSVGVAVVGGTSERGGSAVGPPRLVRERGDAVRALGATALRSRPKQLELASASIGLVAARGVSKSFPAE
ncbi:hypothetical protein T492DRAFT_330818 [Pavlovales sp. CCMP2436]|nr:hypothetical protein T492DRAFT_330818 [Pavlovales sp. CCMP2436]